MKARPKPVRLAPGTRVMDERGELGTIVSGPVRHNGYKVRYDRRFNQFSPEVVEVRSIRLTPIEPKLHAKWEAAWATAAFIDRKWTEAALAHGVC